MPSAQCSGAEEPLSDLPGSTGAAAPGAGQGRRNKKLKHRREKVTQHNTALTSDRGTRQ